MNEIWVRRLIAGTQEWDSMPSNRREPVKAILKERVEQGEITAARYKEITGVKYA